MMGHTSVKCLGVLLFSLEGVRLLGGIDYAIGFLPL